MQFMKISPTAQFYLSNSITDQNCGSVFSFSARPKTKKFKWYQSWSPWLKRQKPSFRWMMILVIGNKKTKQARVSGPQFRATRFCDYLWPTSSRDHTPPKFVRYHITSLHLQLNRRMDRLHENFNQKAVTRVWIGCLGSWGYFHGLRWNGHLSLSHSIRNFVYISMQKQSFGLVIRFLSYKNSKCVPFIVFSLYYVYRAITGVNTDLRTYSFCTNKSHLPFLCVSFTADYV